MTDLPAPVPTRFPLRPVVNRFGTFQVRGKGGGPRNHVRKVRVFDGQIECAISAKCPSGPHMIDSSGSIKL